MTKKTTPKKALVTRNVPKVWDDIKSATLLVSLIINLAILIGWIALKITDKFDSEVATFLFG